jgi:hypothetical protein
VLVGCVHAPSLAAAAETTPVIWVDSNVSLNGPDAHKFPTGFAANVHGGVSARLAKKDLQLVSRPDAPHDAVVRIALLELEWHFHLFGSWGDGKISLTVESTDGRLLDQASRKFRSHEAWELDPKLDEAVRELASATALTRVAARPASAVAPAPPEAAGARRRRVAVLEFRGPLDRAVLAGIADEARGAAAEALRTERGIVMTRESLAVILKDMSKPQGACAEGECEVETGRLVGADLVVTGEVIHVDATYVLILKLHETAGGALVATRQARGKSALDLMDTVKAAAVTLFD